MKMMTMTTRVSTSHSELKQLHKKNVANIQRTEDFRALARFTNQQGEESLWRMPSAWGRETRCHHRTTYSVWRHAFERMKLDPRSLCVRTSIVAKLGHGQLDPRGQTFYG